MATDTTEPVEATDSKRPARSTRASAAGTGAAGTAAPKTTRAAATKASTGKTSSTGRKTTTGKTTTGKTGTAKKSSSKSASPTGAGRGKLVIVESPAKARTIAKYLGTGFTVKASMGHIRDLPKSTLGVEVENDFAPKYLVPRDKNKVVKDLKDSVAKARTIYLATDPDREGEAIAWHLMKATDADFLG